MLEIFDPIARVDDFPASINIRIAFVDPAIFFIAILSENVYLLTMKQARSGIGVLISFDGIQLLEYHFGDRINFAVYRSTFGIE